jgi:acetylornithine deacetylase
MQLSKTLQDRLKALVGSKQDRLVQITRELIRTPSENTPPNGGERDCQRWLARQLQACGLTPELYPLDQVPGLSEHALFHPGRNYRDRPNLAAVRKGGVGGRSLLLSGHIDTVPSGTLDWTHPRFGALVEGNRIYGRGANDMKAGIATNLFVMECLSELNLPLTGDLLFESVVDEEFGGSNGTLAGRLRGHNADAAVLSEPSSLRICPAQRGGRTVHLTFRAASGGVLQGGKFPAGIVPQLTHFLGRLPEFAERRNRGCRPHPMYAHHSDPVPVSVMKVVTGPWGFGEPITTPEKVQLELYWQLMPGETQQDVEREFFEWLHAVVDGAPEIYPGLPEVSLPIRWMPGSSLPMDSPVVQKLSACAQTVTGSQPAIAGIEGPCDLFIFQQGFDIPAVIWGAHGGNTHAADEYVEIDSLVTAATALLLFVAEWCGVAEAGRPS